jgi:uncharacterized protein YbaP (TraB family)
MHEVVRLLIAAAATFIATPAMASPSLWVVKAPRSTVYLFGTIHLLPPGLEWRSPALKRAFHKSRELWLEVALPLTEPGSAPSLRPEAAQRTQLLVNQLGMSPDQPLSAKLTSEEMQQLTELVAPAGVPAVALDRMRPWLAALTLSSARARLLGWTDPGPDVKLSQDAITAGKRIQAFETLEQQMQGLAGMTPEQELSYLRRAITEAEGGKARLETLAKVWVSGDDEAMTRLAVSRVQDTYPALYRQMVVRRNHTWLPKIEKLLGTPGVRLVAVGAGHLLGPDGLLALLEADGYPVQHVQ